MKKIFSAVLLICLSLPVLESGAAAQGKFNNLGYFEDSKKNRIYTISIKQGISRDEVYEYAERLSFTEGRMMAAYFYPENTAIPVDAVKQAKTLYQANDVLYDSPGTGSWRYAFIRSYQGPKAFVDCREDPQNDLCRNNP
jgi:hypothetical protein